MAAKLLRCERSLKKILPALQATVCINILFITPLVLSEKVLFLTTTQHQSIDSICSKTKLANGPKRKCKLSKFTTVQVRLMGEGFSATKTTD